MFTTRFSFLFSAFLICGNACYGGVIVSENLGASAYTASGTYLNLLPQFAFDGVDDSPDYWNSGSTPLGWIEVDLQSIYQIDRIELDVAQDPEGDTVHQIWLSNSPMQSVLPVGSPASTFSQFTTTDDTLVADFSAGILPEARYVQVRTTASPSWVAWDEISVFAPASNDVVPEPTTSTIFIVGVFGLGLVRVRRGRTGLARDLSTG